MSVAEFSGSHIYLRIEFHLRVKYIVNMILEHYHSDIGIMQRPEGEKESKNGYLSGKYILSTFSCITSDHKSKDLL